MARIWASSERAKFVLSERMGIAIGHLALVEENLIKDLIYEIRGQKVMVDFDLTCIYGYGAKRFNEQIKNNSGKFEEDFMFRLTSEELSTILKSKKSASSWGGRRKLPFAFTEQGVYMLMTVLRGG